MLFTAEQKANGRLEDLANEPSVSHRDSILPSVIAGCGYMAIGAYMATFYSKPDSRVSIFGVAIGVFGAALVVDAIRYSYRSAQK